MQRWIGSVLAGQKSWTCRKHKIYQAKHQTKSNKIGELTIDKEFCELDRSEHQ